MTEARRVLVTGASSGIGLALARRLLAAGYAVLGAARGRVELPGLHWLPLDLTQPESIAACAAAAGPLQALVNCAGMPGLGAIEELSEAHLRHVMQVNFQGPLALTRALLPGFRRQGGGRIVMVSSSLAAAALPIYGAYCASKAALEAAGEALRHELAPFGVAVRILRPGLVATPFGDKRQAQAPAADSPYTGRLDTPEPDDLGALISTPEAAAAALQDMIEQDGPFRMTCGADAERWIGAREALSDEDFFAALERGGYAFR